MTSSQDEPRDNQGPDGVLTQGLPSASTITVIRTSIDTYNDKFTTRSPERRFKGA